MVNNSGESATGEITVTVANVNQPPTANPSTAWVTAGTVISHPVAASDPDQGDALQYARVDNTPDAWPATASLTSDGKFVWTPTPLDLSLAPNRTLRFRVTDAAGAMTESTILVSQQMGDTPPVITPISVRSEVAEKASWSFVFDVTEANQQPVFVSVTASDPRVGIITPTPAGASNRYTYTWTPEYDFVKEPDQFLPVTFDVTATDRTTAPVVYKQRVSVSNAANPCDAHDDYSRRLQQAANVIQRTDQEARSLSKSMVWRDGLNLLRDLVSPGLAGWTGKELGQEGGIDASTGAAGAAAALWITLSDKIPLLASADHARTRRTVLQTTRDELQRQARQYADEYRHPSTRNVHAFRTRSTAIQTATMAAEERHSKDDLPQVTTTATDLARYFGGSPAAPAGCPAGSVNTAPN